MAKKTVTRKVKKPDQKTAVTLKKDTIDILWPFFKAGYPARKVARRTQDLNGKQVKMPGLTTILKYFSIWRDEHTYLIREDLAKHQRIIKSELIDQYEEIIITCIEHYHTTQKFVNDHKFDDDNDNYWYPNMLKQLTDHNTLIGELLATKARIEMAPFIDQTSEQAIKKNLEQDVERQTLENLEKKK